LVGSRSFVGEETLTVEHAKIAEEKEIFRAASQTFTRFVIAAVRKKRLSAEKTLGFG
jgi:hypothetical protein